LPDNAKGIIIKGIGGFYSVDIGSEIITCSLRGRFRKDKIVPLVGDRVEISIIGEGRGRVDAILPRTNEFLRPAVANIDLMIIVASSAQPVTDEFLIDRMLAALSAKAVDIIVCINKFDLDRADRLFEIYSGTGYRTLRISAKTGYGMDALKEALRGKVCAFTGNSGVGKSSILNMLEPGFSLETGEISPKLGRGRHTTREVEFYKLSFGATVADTPGFSSFDAEQLNHIPKQELQHAFRDFAPYLQQCRYRSCSHTKEADCAVREAVERGEISESRYASYVRIYEGLGKPFES